MNAQNMQRTVRRLLTAVLTVALVALAGACVTTRPWQREQLAKPVMTPDPDPDREALRLHLLGVREGTSGGFGGGGGGCGCN